MNWDDVSDFGINKAVAKLQGHKCYYGDDSFTNGSMGDSVAVKGKNIVGAIDYCKHWDVTGPLISDNDITITPIYYSDCKTWCAGGDYNVLKKAINPKAHNENPLRAAAIVYLMMNGVKAEDCK
ncbi:MAG: phage protein NinX family protein [Reinekea sp.]|nr:phage protein NinX family protein [Reinekea sp.]